MVFSSFFLLAHRVNGVKDEKCDSRTRKSAAMKYGVFWVGMRIKRPRTRLL